MSIFPISFQPLCVLLIPAEPVVPSRLTPFLYETPHARTSFGPTGQLVQVSATNPQQGQPALVTVQHFDQLVETNDAEKLRLYPGPLIK